MSITVTKDLPFVGCIGNPMELGLETDNMYTDDGSFAVFGLNFTGIDTTPGHSFKVSYNDIEITFTLTENLDDSGTTIRVAETGESIDSWIEKVAADMYRNYYLSRDFKIETSAVYDHVKFTARNKGTKYNAAITEINLVNVTGFLIYAVDQQLRDNFNILVRTVMDNGIINEDIIPPDQSGNCLVDLHDIFSGQLTPEFYWPESTAPLYVHRENFCKEYEISYAELYDNNVFALTQYSRTVHAILGAFDYKMLAGLNDITYSFLDFITTFKAFLTWQPIQKTINKTQPEKLFYLIYDDFSHLKLKLKIYYTDNSESAPLTPVNLDGGSMYDVFEFMVGYAALDVEQYSTTKTVKKYEVWIEDGSDNVRSHVRTFIVDTNDYRHERIFLFRNSFGAFDTFRATGRKKHINNYERMVIEKNVSDFSVQEQYLVLENSTFSINSGWISSQARSWLRELFLSKEAYEIINGYKFPISITDKKRPLSDDNDYLHEVTINYKYSFKDPAYTGDYNLMPLLAENLNVLLNENGEWLFA